MRSLAVEAGIDVDEALITLWDEGFDWVVGPSDTFDRGDANRARRALGLASRRELASAEYWQAALAVDAQGLIDLIQTLGVVRPYDGGKLTKRAQRRLGVHTRQSGLVAGPEQQGASAAPTEDQSSPLEWESVGHVADLRCLSLDDVAAIHEALVSDFSGGLDPIVPAGVKNEHLLASAVARPLTSNANVTKYPTIEMGAAALLHAIVHNHPFHNGNKRTALVAMLVFLDENGFALTCEEDELFKLVLQLAQHALASGPRHELPDREVLAVTKWLRPRIRWVEKGDRHITWRHLRPILVGHGCQCDEAGQGNRFEISRKVVRRRASLLGRDKTVVLHSSVAHVSDGRDIDRNSVKTIRKELELDEEHGIDTAAFYDDAAVSPSEFIKTYHKTLRRLARL